MGDWTARNEQRTIRIKEQQPPLGALLRWLGTMLFLPRIAHLFVSLSREKSTLNQRIAASHYESIIPTRDALKINSQGLLKKYPYTHWNDQTYSVLDRRIKINISLETIPGSTGHTQYVLVPGSPLLSNL